MIAPVVLDDALVYSDDGRFERMRLALRRAASNLQILILTSREPDWMQAGPLSFDSSRVCETGSNGPAR